MKSLLVILILLHLISPVSLPKEPVVNLGGLDLAQKELFELTILAMKGDKNACTRVAGYYSLTRGEHLTAALWWKLLADKGDLDGIYGMGTELMLGGDLSGAKKWLINARELGHQHAGASLRDLEAREKQGGRGTD